MIFLFFTGGSLVSDLKIVYYPCIQLSFILEIDSESLDGFIDSDDSLDWDSDDLSS